MVRTKLTKVTFTQAFRLKEVDEPCPAGTYEVATDEETIDDLTFLAWRRVATMIYLNRGEATQVIRLDPSELDALLQRDAGQRSLA